MSNEVIPVETLRDMVEACTEILNNCRLVRSFDVQPIGMQGHFRARKGTTFNAYAEQYPGQPPNYGVYYGLMLGVLDLCMEIAADAAFLSEIEAGSNKLLTNAARNSDRFQNYPDLDLDTSALSYLARVPEEEHRQRVGWYLFTFAMRFVALHEQGHYLSGHLRLKPGRLAELDETRDEMQEVEPPAQVEQPAIELTLAEHCALELEADCFAHRNAALMGAYRWEEYQQSATLDDFIPTCADWCMLQFLGAAIVGLLLSYLSRCREDAKHPTPECRLFGLMNDTTYIRRRVAEESGEDRNDEWENAIPRAFRGLQVAADTLGDKTAQSLRDVIISFTERSASPARDEYIQLAQLLHSNQERFSKARLEVEEEIGGAMM